VVVGGTLLIAGGQAPKLLTAIHEPLDAIAQAVDSSIERPVVTLILLTWDRDPDTMLAGVLPNVPAAVSFIPHDTLGSALGTAWPTPLDGTSLHELFEDHRLMSLSRCEDEGHQLATPFGS